MMHSYVSHIQVVECFEGQIQINLRTITHVVVGTVTFQIALYHITLFQHMRFNAYIYIMFGVDVVQVYCVYIQMSIGLLLVYMQIKCTCRPAASYN
jgi:hypothetical protein